MADDLETPAEEPSLRDTIAEAFEADAATQDAPGVVAPPAIPSEPAKAPDAPQGERARAPDGKFAKTPEQAQSKAEPVPPQPGAEPPKTETIGPPLTWSAAAKAEFAKLSPVIQQEVLKREKDMDAGKAQWDQKAERLNRLDSILAPRRQNYLLRGLDDAQRVQALLAAEELLERDPRAGLTALAQQFGVDLRTFAQQQGQPAQQPMHPQLQAFANEINTLKQSLAQRDNQASQAVQSQLQSEVHAFRTDPKNIYFDNVKDDMVALIQTGRATKLQDAYDMAVWANPATRTLVVKAQQDQQAAEIAAAAKVKSRDARYASGSVTGSPHPGSSPVSGGSANATVGDDLRAAWAEHA